MQAAEAIRSEMMDAVRLAGYRLAPEASVKARRHAVVRATKLPAALVDRLWYGNISRIDAVTADTVRELIRADQLVRQATQTTIDLQAEIAELSRRFDRLISLIGDGKHEAA